MDFDTCWNKNEYVSILSVSKINLILGLQILFLIEDRDGEICPLK